MIDNIRIIILAICCLFAVIVGVVFINMEYFVVGTLNMIFAGIILNSIHLIELKKELRK